jgi:hypothetical protein
MTRAHAARQLLALGPLSFAEFVAITGWPYARCRCTMKHLVDGRGEVVRDGGLYRIAA